VKESLGITVSRARASPERTARAVAWKPEQRKMSRVDSPHAELICERRFRPVRREARDRGIFADMPERV